MDESQPSSQPADVDAQTLHSTVEQIIPVPCHTSPASFNSPALISFRVGTQPPNGSTLKLSVKRPRQPASEPSPPRQNASPHVFAEAANRLWRAEPGFDDYNTNYYVGIRSKSTGKIRLVQLNATYSMRPEVTGDGWLDQVDKAENDEDDEDKDDDVVDDESTDPARAEYLRQRRKLLLSFGGRKSQRKIAKYERDRVTAGNIQNKSVEQINEAAKEMLEKDAAVGIHHNREQTTEADAPPHDNSATVPGDAYPLLGLISPQEMIFIERKVEELERSVSNFSLVGENPGWHPLVWEALDSIVALREISDELRKTRLQAAIHLHNIIKVSALTFYVTPEVRRQLETDTGLDASTTSVLLHRFTSPVNDEARRNQRMTTMAERTKLCKHGIIMWMTALGFVNCARLGELASALHVTFKVLMADASSLGCNAKKLKEATGPSAFRISLKTPLVFPVKKPQAAKRPQRRM